MRGHYPGLLVFWVYNPPTNPQLQRRKTNLTCFCLPNYSSRLVLGMFGKFVYNVRYLDKAYLGNECFTKPEGSGLWLPQLEFFFSSLKKLQHLILFGTSYQILWPRYVTDCIVWTPPPRF